jgi:hypothetical protein
VALRNFHYCRRNLAGRAHAPRLCSAFGLHLLPRRPLDRPAYPFPSLPICCPADSEGCSCPETNTHPTSLCLLALESTAPRSRLVLLTRRGSVEAPARLQLSRPGKLLVLSLFGPSLICLCGKGMPTSFELGSGA